MVVVLALSVVANDNDANALLDGDCPDPPILMYVTAVVRHLSPPIDLVFT